MVSKAMQQAISDQINMELYSSYLYLAMSSYCERESFAGSAHWLRVQASEELTHAMKLYDFLVFRGAEVTFKAIPAPAGDFKSLPAVFEAAHKHEQKVTASINKLYELAHKEKEFATAVDLQWFLTEQVEEEKNTRLIVGKFRLVKNDTVAWLDIDAELGARAAAGAKSNGGGESAPA